MSVFGGVERSGVNINGNVCLGGGMIKVIIEWYVNYISKLL